MREEPWSLEWRIKELSDLKEQWSQCDLCPLHEDRNNIVFGRGNPSADILFCGEAPGVAEDEKGEPFVGESGVLLQSMCNAVGIDWDKVYVTNLVSCRPPNNRKPVKSECDSCVQRLHRIIYIVDPLIIVAVGGTALQILARGRTLSIEKNHGEIFSPGLYLSGKVFPKIGDNKIVYNIEYDVVPIYHPAFLLRKDSYNEEVDSFTAGGVVEQTVADLEKIQERCNRIKALYEKTHSMLMR